MKTSVQACRHGQGEEKIGVSVLLEIEENSHHLIVGISEVDGKISSLFYSSHFFGSDCFVAF